MDTYIRKILRVSVAQICQTIGYNSIQSIPLELLIDSLHKFLQEIARDLHRHVELFNRTEANLDDVALSLHSLNISVTDLLEYINHVQPVGCSIEIPKLPALKTSNLNFLKPGSKEVLTRPVHIYEHLPPILRENGDIEDKSNIATTSLSPNSDAVNANNSTISSQEYTEDVGSKSAGQQLTEFNDITNAGIVTVENNNFVHQSLDMKRKSTLDSTVSPSTSTMPSSATREISSVMMTSGGFISPAIEGRMPECIIPDIVEKYFGLDTPPTTTPQVTVSSQMAAPPGKTAILSPSSTLNPSHSTSSLRALIKNEDPAVSSTGLKMPPTIDKKLLKKVKKKAMSAMVYPNIQGTAPPVLNDKAQRKRIKMLQKSMAKGSTCLSSGTYKIKSSGNVSQGSQDKYLKKQYKLKQKQIRQQYVQKQTEVVLNASSIFSTGGRGHPGHVSSQSTETGSSSKPKKDQFVVSAPLIEEKPSLDSESSISFLTPASFPPSKTIYHHPLAGPQDIKSNPTLVQVPQSALNGPPSPQYDEVKLSNEPDRSKLNIFKKISSSGRKDRADAASAVASAHPITTPSIQLASTADVTVASSSNTAIFGNDQVISLPSGTTITPAPPSGSGRHVYAPPPSTQSSDFDSVITVDDDGSIPEGSAVLMQRGDLMIHKPKKRGRKPGSKNQPKILGLPAKKTKKLKKSLFGHHSTSNLLEPLNLSHSSIANIANIPLGIASTFPIDPEAALKIKKDRKKAKLGKDANFVRSTGKSSNTRNLAPTKEEFASINQKLMMMDTVLQAAPPLPTSTNLMSTSKTGRSNSPPLGVAADPGSSIRVKKERKRPKQVKDPKQILQQGTQPLSNTPQTSKTSTSTGSIRKSPLPYTAPNFPNVPGMGGIAMFPFYPFPARPGLIPSHNLFSQLPNMQNNALFMPPLMGFRPLNPPIRNFLKDEKELTPPILQAGEGNYSKVAPLVPDTMKLELSPVGRTPISSPGASGPKLKTPSMNSTTLLKNACASPSGQISTAESSTEPSILSIPGNTMHFGDFRKKCDEHNSSTVVSSSCGSNLNILKSVDVTIEVSSDESVQDEISNRPSSLTHRTPIPTTAVSSTSGLNRQSHPSNDFAVNNISNIVDDSETFPIERRNKDLKKLKKLGKQGKKQSISSAPSELKNISKAEFVTGISNDVNDDVSSMLVDIASESVKKNDESANSSSHTAFEYGISPERRKDHKKMKKLLREGKLKKKKDKKDKNKSKDRNDRMVKSEKSEKRKEEKKDKDKVKKLKKEKKKEKQRTDMEVTAAKYTSSGEGTGSATDVSSIVPKLTLKLGQSSQSPTPVETTELRKASLKSSLNLVSDTGCGITGTCTSSRREPSPELARISPLVTRPPKQKPGTEDAVISSNMGNTIPTTTSNSFGTGLASSTSHQTPSLSASLNVLVESVIDIDSNSGEPTTSMLPASATILGLGMNTAINISPARSVAAACSTSSGTIAASVQSGTSQHNQHQMPHQNISSNKHSAAVPLISETNRPSSYIDAEGNRVWICPACGKVDDGSAMIGCDGCDAWYHWVCVGIFVAPNDNEDWYCRVCIAKKRGVHGGDRKRKRNKKKNMNV